MGFHDEMARQALVDGQTSDQYRSAAQKHANAMWIYLLIAGAVWFFTAWYWALIPAALALFVAAQSASATAVAIRLEKVKPEGD